MPRPIPSAPFEPKRPRPDDLDTPDCLYVMTRMADPLTNVLADELARIFARHWGGRIFE